MSSGTYIIQPTTVRKWNHRLDAPGSQSGDTLIRSAITNEWSKSDVKNPRWRDQVKKVRQAGTAFSGTRKQVIYLPGSYTCRWLGAGDGGSNPPWHECFDYVSGQPENISTAPWVAVPSDDSTVLNRARARFIQASREANRAIQAGVSAGELGETLRMIRSPARALREGIPSLFRDVIKRTGKGTTRRRAKEIAAETWLEYAFGWRPLVQDVAQGIDYLQRRGKPLLSKTQYVREADYKVTPSGITFSLLGPLADCYVSKQVFTQNIIHHIYYGVVGIKDSLKYGGDRSLLGLTWSDVPSTVWELIPWSFLIDYFTNVGAVIDSWAFNTSTLRWKCHTTRRIGEHVRLYNINAQACQNSVGGVWEKFQSASDSPGSMTFRQSSVVRDIIPELLVDVTWHIPGSSTKWTNIAALAAMKRSSRGHYSRLG